MADENDPNQGNTNNPPPPEVVRLDPRIIQEGESREFTAVVEIIQGKGKE